MKLNIFITLILASGFGASSYGADLRAYDVKNCEFWNTMQNGGGFVCASWPNTIRVAEASSFAREIRILEQKIAELEKKINNLQNNRRD